MRLRSRDVLSVCFILLIQLITYVVAQSMTYAQTTDFVQVHISSAKNGGEIRIEPKDIRIDDGSTVIWFNMGDEDIRVNFKEGKLCVAGTDAPSRFDLTQCEYMTTWVPPGATASLRFIQSGTYSYEVIWKDAGVKEMGQVIVE